ncbi:RloB family protein [Ferruginibacter sp. HRS2-29]|uniref:RloB family protein n=1 Tax=Ferruginibacter sp. HRS2-29 TaxID=2487334 RepID=UPI0020CE1A57|nr:RloB family protein [Ferruginibacter sp. HRS2-29]MCP9750877.1 RloB domain-containing protein [Ferruginibacter sp. HRS2-29]
MPKPKIFTYEKKAPFRDAFLFIIVCEGTNREPDYFRFFDGMSSRVKIVPVVSQIGSAPRLLINVAIAKEQELEASDERDRLWFVIDTDRWREQLHEIREECEQHPHWKVAQSNPCFEVWLYFHAKGQLPALPNISQCNNWKPHLPTIIQGGFNADFHPIAIEVAITNSKNTYQATGYFPNPGSTQLWELGEELLPLIKKDLDRIKDKFPHPAVIE